VLGALLCLLAVPASAQPLSLAFDQLGPDLATVAGWQYRLSVNGGPTVPLTVTCTGTVTLFTCLTPFDATTIVPGVKQSLTVTTCDLLTTLCSLASVQLHIIQPDRPRSLRLQ